MNKFCSDCFAQYERDGFGQITMATYQDGLTEQFTYDPMRRLIKAVDRAGRETHLEYWPIGKVKSITRLAPVIAQETGIVARVSFDYDEQGADLKITDELGRVVEGYALDAAGRPTAVTNILGQTMQITYALLDLPRQINRFDGSYVNFAYDVAWRPTSIIYPDDTVTQRFSGAGLLLSVGDQTSGTILNKYDALSRWAGQTGPRTWDVITVANGVGGLISSLTSVGGTVSYSSDIGSRLSSLSGSAGTFNYSYNPTNGLIAGVSCSAINAAYTFDVLDRIKQMEWTSGTNIVRRYDYDYNTVGMITQKVTAINGQLSTNSYAYDALDRLISESSFSPQTSAISLFMYDLVGNRTQMVQNGETINYTLSAGNRLVNWGVDGTNSSMKYDAAGNVTSIYFSSSSQLALKWDSRYRVTSVYTNGSLAESYGYDALDRRTSISDGATTNYLIYAGVHVIAEVGTSGSLVRSYTYGPGIDNILSMTVYGGTTQTYYYVKDHLGSVQAIVDSTGSIVESYQYDAWGNVLEVKDGSGNSLSESAIGNRILWQGREYSWATHLYYFRARWYEPVTGRWLSNDPIGISGGLNQYVFCGNDPVNYVDPFGLCGDRAKRMRNSAGRQMYRSGFFGPWAQWYTAWRNHGFYGRYDVGPRGGADYYVHGRYMTPSEFGNYLAGYAGAYGYGPIGEWAAHVGGNLLGFLGGGENGYIGDSPASAGPISEGAADAYGDRGGIPIAIPVMTPMGPWIIPTPFVIPQR